jgi:hypothetical protein
VIECKKILNRDKKYFCNCLSPQEKFTLVIKCISGFYLFRVTAVKYNFMPASIKHKSIAVQGFNGRFIFGFRKY